MCKAKPNWLKDGDGFLGGELLRSWHYSLDRCVWLLMCEQSELCLGCSELKPGIYDILLSGELEGFCLNYVEENTVQPFPCHILMSG